jgi:hypothetical protein
MVIAVFTLSIIDTLRHYPLCARYVFVCLLVFRVGITLLNIASSVHRRRADKPPSWSLIKSTCRNSIPRTQSIKLQFPSSTQISIYHSPHSPSSFFPGPPPPLFLTALVPIPLGFFFSCILLSPTLENSSQKSCLSFAGPFGA